MADKQSDLTLNDLIAPKKVEPIPGGPQLKEAIQGATFGFGEEALAGLRSMIPGQPGYEPSLRAERQQLREYESKEPYSAMGYQIAGSVVPAIGEAITSRSTAPLAQPISKGLGLVSDLVLKSIEKYSPGVYQMLPDIMKIGISGAEAGAKYGAGTAEQDRLQAAMGGAIEGGKEALILGGTINVLGPAYRALFGNPDTEAGRKIAAALEADKTTPEELVEKMKKSGKGAEITVADVAGENLQALMRTAAAVPGEARQATTKFLDERQKQQYNRIVKDVEQTMTGKKGVDINQVKRDLDDVRKKVATPLYESANKVKIENTPELATLINRMPNQVLAIGREALKTEGLPIPKLPPTIEELVQVPIRDKAGNVTYLQMKPETNDFKVYDLLKKGLDELIDKEQDKVSGKFSPQGTRLIDLKNDFLAYLDKANPDYGQARQLWAGPTRSTRMLDKGRNVFKIDPTNVAYEFKKLSPVEQEYFRLGAAQAMKDILAGKGSMVDKAKALFDKPEQVQALRPIFPSQAAFDVFKNRIESEQLMARTRGFVAPRAGSQTALRQQDIEEFGTKGTTGILSPLLAGDFRGAALQAAPAVYGKVTGLTPPVTSSLQKSLLTPGVTSKDLAQKLAAARKAEELSQKIAKTATKGVVAPFTSIGPTQQYPSR